MKPKGKLLIIGGHEEKGDEEEKLKVAKRVRGYERFEILRTLIKPGSGHTIEIITLASSIPEEIEEWYSTAYDKQGFRNIGFLRLEDHTKKDETLYIDRIRKAHAVLFTGGDQVKLVDALKDSKVLEAIKQKYAEDEDFILAGTSAGAMAFPEIIIEAGLIGEVLFKDDLSIGKGFAILKNVIVDTHFIERGRFARLAQAVIQNPDCLGIGLGDNTALLISNGNEAECKGSGMVILVDGSSMGSNNAGIARNDIAVAAENLRVHILVDGCKFFLEDKKFVLPES